MAEIFFVILRSQTASQKPGHGLCGRVGRHNKSVYSTLFLGYQESGKFNGKVKNVANSRCLSGYVYSVRIRRASVGYGRIAYSA